MTTWLIIFTLLCVATIFVLEYNKPKMHVLGFSSSEDMRYNLLFCLLCIVGIGITCYISANSIGFKNDVACFENWAKSANADFTNFYNNGWCDYPPFYIYMLSIAGFFINNGILSAGIAFRLPPIICTIALAYIVFKIGRERSNNATGLFAASFILFNPLILLDTASWGQMDIVLTTFIVFFLYLLLKDRVFPATIVLALSLLIKPQAAFFLPVLIIYLIKYKKFTTFCLSGLTGLVTIILIILPFNKEAFTIENSTTISNTPMLQDLFSKLIDIPIIKDIIWLFDLLSGTASNYQYISLNAANFYSIFGMNANPNYMDSRQFLFTNYGVLGIILIGLVIIIACVMFWKTKNSSKLWLSAALLNTGIFMFATRMHERYMFSVFILLFISWLFTRDWPTLILSLGFMITNFFNVEDCLTRMITLDYPHIPSDSIRMITTSVFNLILTLSLFVLFYFATKDKFLETNLGGLISAPTNNKYNKTTSTRKKRYKK